MRNLRSLPQLEVVSQTELWRQDNVHKFKVVDIKRQFGVQFLYNSEVMLSSEPYKSKSSAFNCIDSIKRYAPYAPVADLSQGQLGKGHRFEIVETKDQRYFVRFIASNGETMVTSVPYSSKSGATNCAHSAQVNSSEAPVEDES